MLPELQTNKDDYLITAYLLKTRIIFIDPTIGNSPSLHHLMDTFTRFPPLLAENGFLAGLRGIDYRLAEAASKGREKRCAGHPPPFNGMKVIVHTGDARRTSFQRLLELGGAQVLYDAKPPFSNVPGTYLRFVKGLPKTDDQCCYSNYSSPWI